MTFKIQQVLRTKAQLKGENGKTVPAGTRVVVMGMRGERARVKVVDTAHTDIAKVRLSAKPEMFDRTYRGRPKGGKKA